MRLPIDTSTIKFATAGPAEPLLGCATKVPKTDENGTPLYGVPVFASIRVTKDVSGDLMPNSPAKGAVAVRTAHFEDGIPPSAKATAGLAT
jgi:hypothetical protein